jgi:hypothetical protein
MRMFLILAGLALSLAAEPQEIYRWVDRNGQVHYSDQPGAPNAERVILVDPNTYASEPSFGDAAPNGAEPDVVEETATYTSLAIVQPTPDQVFFGADATVVVAVELDANLRSDHSLVFFVNGNRRPAAGGLGLELTGLERGTYFLRASVLDQNGTPVISSQQTTFHVRQPSINSPQSPQAPRPRPPPPVPAPTN